MTLREATVREWALLSGEARLGLRRYLLHYVVGCARPPARRLQTPPTAHRALGSFTII